MGPLEEHVTRPAQILPLVSVVVPTYNRAEALTRCLQGLLEQTYPHELIEIIVVDDGGTVDPAPVVARFDGFRRIAVLRQRNGGPASARNRGAREATSEFLAFTDDDCRPRRDWIMRLIETIARRPEAMVGGRVANGLVGNAFAQASQDLVSFLYEYFPRARALRPFFTTNNIAVHRETFLRMGGFDRTFRFSAGEDRDLSERWMRSIGPLEFIGEAVVDHFHELNFGRFVRQHHHYGRGAVNLARCRLARGDGPPSPEPLSFYARMVTYPLRRRSFLQGTKLGCLVAIAQLAGLTGMAAEALRPVRASPVTRRRAADTTH